MCNVYVRGCTCCCSLPSSASLTVAIAMRTSVLVFLQNGYIDTYLEKNKLLENTQALLFFAVTAKGADPIDGVTTVNPEGLTSVTGKHAEDFKKRLDKLDLKCNVLSKGSYEKAMWEKLIWICAYMLVGTAKDCASVGEAQEKHGDVVKSLVGELAESVDGVTFDGGVMDRLAAYTDVVSNFPCAVKEFEWRNQAFYNKGCALHDELLAECEKKGKFTFP